LRVVLGLFKFALKIAQAVFRLIELFIGCHELGAVLQRKLYSLEP
jgi:hypothetical protein